MAESVKLSALEPGARASIVQVEGEDRVARRLRDLGFWPGTLVEVVRRAPFGDPTQYRLRGYRIALRKAEAARVAVTLTAAEGAA